MRMFALLALAGLTVPGTVLAVASCPDKAPAAITTVGAAALKCQETIAKVGTGYVAAKLKTLLGCKLKNPAGACPLTKDIEKMQKTATKAADKIAKDCGLDSVQAALTSSYNLSADEAAIGSCSLSQQSVAADFVSADTIGPTTEALPGTGKERAACIKEVAKDAAALVAGLLKNVNGCVKAQMKLGTAGNLAPICVGSFSGGSFVPPTDTKTADKQAKLFQKTDDKIANKCGPAAGLSQIVTMFGCPGAASIADLQACLTCDAFNATVDVVGAQYSETGTLVANGPGALQTAVSAASPGQKLLIGSGDYAEEVLVTADDLQLVGCGAATNNRPRVIPPPVVAQARGIRAFGVDGLVFQSIAVFDQDQDGIFVQGADGVTFRDIVGDGNFNSKYAVFPIQSDNVVIELCTVRAVADAGLYIGQSGKTLLRHNDVRTSVAGIEFENTVNGTAYGNYATDNTAGMLVFKDNDLIDQSSCHDIHHNVFDANNRVNIGTGTVGGVPDGTGWLVIANDSTLFYNNISRNHRSFGYSLINQAIAGFTPVDPDPEPDSDFFYNNHLGNNGFDPHPLSLGIGGDIVSLNGGTGNCASGNVSLTGDPLVVVGALPACSLPPAPFGACPAPFTIP